MDTAVSWETARYLKTFLEFTGCQSLLEESEKTVQTLKELIDKVDVVISLLPYALHPMVAEQCIAGKTNMVTASYLSEPMKALHQKCVF